MATQRTLVLTLLGSLLAALPAEAQTPLKVGAPERPPFSSKGTDEAWEGLGIDLWRIVAEELQIPYTLTKVPEADIGGALSDGTIDVAVVVDATPEIGDIATLSIPYYTATLAIAEEQEFTIWRVVRNLVDSRFLQIVASLSALLMMVGLLMWLAERRKNAQFDRRPLHGLGDGFWWAAVTMTTIGYGDKAPVTTVGRTLALIWMLFGLAISAALTAAVISATNVTGDDTLTIPSDVVGKRIAVLPDSSAAAYLGGFGVDLVSVDSPAAGLAAIRAHKVDALAGGGPELRAAMRRLGADLNIRVTRQDPQYVAFAIGPSTPEELQRTIPRAVLSHITSEDWWVLVSRYLPTDD